MQLPAIPYTILALAPTGPVPDHSYATKAVTTDLPCLDKAMETLGPAFYVSVPQSLCPEGRLTIQIKRMKDFKPDSVVRNTSYLRGLFEAAGFIEEALSNGRGAGEIAKGLQSSWPDIPLEFNAGEPKLPADKSGDVRDDILEMVAMPGKASKSASVGSGGPRDWKARIEGLLTSLLEHIYGNEEFRCYESVWRGIEVLLKQGPVKETDGIRLKIVPASLNSLDTALEKLTTQLLLDLPNLILIDFPFDSSPRSIELLERVAAFAESMLVPTVCWVAPRFFYLEKWTDLDKLPYLRSHLEGAAFAKWRKLREQSSCGWLTLTCNSFISRPPYGRGNAIRAAFHESAPLWSSPVWALGALAAQSVNKFGWPSRLTDYANIQLKNLGLQQLSGGTPISTEMSVSEDRILQFTETGMTPLVGMLNKDLAFFPKAVSVGGDSLAYRMLISRALSFFFWCKDNLDEAIREGDIAENLKREFSLFWEKTAGCLPEELSVEAGEATEQGSIPLRISVVPPKSVMRGTQALDFTFTW